MTSPASSESTVVTRFAPSPTGQLHRGHAFSALTAWSAARDAGGRFLLRIEDTDFTRCRPEYEAAILDDLTWLSLDWETPVRRQSEHRPDYDAALERLRGMGVLYRCFRTRKDLLALAGVGIEAAAAVAERLRAAIAGQPWAGVAAGLRVSVSIGVAAAVETATLPELFALADQRLYAAKLGGRDRVVSLSRTELAGVVGAAAAAFSARSLRP